MPRQAITAARTGQATYTVTDAPQRPRRQSRPIGEYRKYEPTQLGEKTSSGIGLLEAEYFAILFLLILQLFVGTSDYGSKMLSFMKRGTLTTILFFILALVAGTGDNTAKIAKAIGALVFFAILLTSPGSDVINALDNLFKADWISNPATPSADTGTQSSTTGVAASAQQKAVSAAESAIQKITKIVESLGFGFIK
jgi:hypothetical protein